MSISVNKANLTPCGDFMVKRYFTVPEIANYLGMSPNSIRAWVRLRRIPYSKLGRAVRFDIQKINTWAEEQSKKTLDFHLRRECPVL